MIQDDYFSLPLPPVNKIAPGLMYAAIDILGKDEIERNLKSGSFMSKFLKARDFDISDLDGFLKMTLDNYDPVSACGFSQRMGMVFFHYLRRTSANDRLHIEADFKLKSFNEQVEVYFSRFFQFLQKEMKFQAGIFRLQKSWSIELKFFSKGAGHSLAAFFFKGVLQELFEWLDCHYRYQIDFLEKVQDNFSQIRYTVEKVQLE